jgi:macrolide-specific efflux system membrane fusion protein
MRINNSVSRRVWAKAVLAGLSIVASPLVGRAAIEGLAPSNEFAGHTAPVEKREQNFDVPGVVDKVLVKEGDAVKAGQLIAQQDTASDEARLQAVQLVAASNLEIKAEEAQLAKDEVDLARKGDLIKQQAIAPSEYEEAKLAVTIDGLKAAHAREDHQKAQYDVAEQKAKINQKQLHARVDGVVSQISTHEGELADTQHPAITIVRNDVLYVEVDMPADVVNRLKAAGTVTPLQVRYVDEGPKGTWYEARIHFIKPEADAASNFEHVQLEMQNPPLRSAGLQVMVKVPDSVAGTSGVPRISLSR